MAAIAKVKISYFSDLGLSSEQKFWNYSVKGHHLKLMKDAFCPTGSVVVVIAEL